MHRHDLRQVGAGEQGGAIGGRLEAKVFAAGTGASMADAVIAGIGVAHELVIITRDTSHCSAVQRRRLPHPHRADGKRVDPDMKRTASAAPRRCGKAGKGRAS